MIASPQSFYSQIVHIEPPAVCQLWLWFSPQAQVPMVVFTMRKPQLPLFTCEPRQSCRWQFVSIYRCKKRSPFPFFFFFNLHSPKLSYPIPWFLFVCLFCFVLFFSQVYRRLTPWFWLSFSSEQPSWLPNFNQGLPAISSHSHFLFFIFLINLMLSCLSI